MKKFLIIALLFSSTCYAQKKVWYEPSSYRNLEKYWWYRYRLVNDFMKIGTGCGESIPMSQWIFSSPYNEAHWGDAGVDLGNYILALAGEWRILNDSRMDTRRTEEELYDAIYAIYRLDAKAEPIWRNYDRNYPLCGLGDFLNSNDLNGFFIRDDVQSLSTITTTNPSGLTNFVMQNAAHFHRPGSSTYTTTDVTVKSDFGDRVSVLGHPAPSWPYSVTRGPVEESQDQLVDLYAGLGMAGWLLKHTSINPDPVYNSWDLGNQAREELYRMVEYIPNNTCRDVWTWTICNPVRNACVYGISPSQSGCNPGGGELSFNSYGLVEGLSHIGLPNSVSGATYRNLQNKRYPGMGLITSIVGLQPETEAIDKYYTDLYAAFADDIFTHNITKNQLAKLATSNKWCWPHIPYIWQIINGAGPGSTIWFNTHNKKYYNEPWMMPDLLSYAPFCGCHSYDPNTPSFRSTDPTHDWGESEDFPGQAANYWASGNRLQDWYTRCRMWAGKPAMAQGKAWNDNSDYNNLDYMAVHNLNEIIEPGAFPKGLMNSYYKENYNVNYGFSSTGYGSKASPLKLNFLEYLSMINKIGPSGDFRVRGAKVIDLEPGFDAQSGGVFDAITKDYFCQQEVYVYAMAAGENPIDNGKLRVTKNLDSPSVVNTDDSAYHPLDFPPDGVAYHIDPDPDKVFNPEDQDTSVLSDAYMANIYDSLVNTVLTSGDSILINMLLPFIQTDSPSMAGQRLVLNSNSIIRIYPNPSNGDFTLFKNANNSCDLSILDMLGKKIFEQNNIFDKVKLFSLKDMLVSGTYTVVVTTLERRNVFKLVVIK
ncbi:MAG: T9SS type A sorting domain-containing protein [Chitinophagaceae bacterium]